MRPSRPPAVATWFVRHFGCGPNNDAVLGDLAERYESRKSALWYWQEAIIAVVVSIAVQVRRYKLLTLRAVAIGWVFLTPFGYLHPYVFQINFAFVSWSRWWRNSWLNGWVDASTLFMFAVFTGWIVGRLHRAHRMAMVAVFAASVWVYDFILFVVRYHNGSFVVLSYLHFVSYSCILVTIGPLGILVGGLLSTSVESGREETGKLAGS